MGKLTLKGKLIFSLVGLLALFGVTMYFFANTQIVEPLIISKLNADHALGYSLLNREYPGEWALKDGKPYKGDRLMNGETQFVDEVKKRTGSVATIFLDNVRLATCVLKEDGSRAVGTKVAPEVENAVLRGGKEFIGQAMVVGKPFQTKYSPIKDKDGKTVGMWFVGVSRHEVRTFNINMGIFIAAVIAVGILILGLTTASVAKKINHIATGLQGSANEVFVASGQVSSASQSLADGASEQASGLEETSSSLEEMSSMTKQNAENAHQAKTMMGEAYQIVENVNQQMGQMGQAIGEVTKSSEETSKIIKTIDEIAFQTNLLALNAAVEAARAGEAGAGFAVVADEVRNLAMRAAEAAKNTSHLIENTIKSIKTRHDLTLATQEAFKKNVEISSKIGKLIDEIAAASQEQAQGIGQVNKAVAELDKVVQQNAANAGQSAGAAKQLNAQAQQMKGYVNDLVAVVRGSRNGQGGVSEKEASPRSSGDGGEKALPAPVERAKRMELAVRKTRNVRPDQVTPLGGEISRSSQPKTHVRVLDSPNTDMVQEKY